MRTGLTFAVVLTIAACTRAAPGGTEAPTAGVGATQAPAASGCTPATSGLIAAITSGLDAGLSLRNAQVVKSDDFEEAHFISADLQGPGLVGTDDIATWVTNKPEGSGGLIYSVDAVAEEFSDWGPGGQTDAGFSMSDDGARESADCARE